MLTNLFSGPPEGEGGPQQMKGREPVQGAAVAGVIVVVAVLNLSITTGAGAPAHPTLWYSYVAIALAAGLVVSLRVRNRLLSPFVAIFAAFFVTLAKAPTALGIPHIVALVTAVGFALVVSMRQRKEQKALGLRGGSADRRAAADARRRRRKGEPEPPPAVARPTANRRYTPPKKAKTPPR